MEKNLKEVTKDLRYQFDDLHEKYLHGTFGTADASNIEWLKIEISLTMATALAKLAEMRW